MSRSDGVYICSEHCSGKYIYPKYKVQLKRELGSDWEVDSFHETKEEAEKRLEELHVHKFLSCAVTQAEYKVIRYNKETEEELNAECYGTLNTCIKHVYETPLGKNEIFEVFSEDESDPNPIHIMG